MTSATSSDSLKPWPSDLDHLFWLKTIGLTSLKGLRILDLGCGSGYICHKAIDDGALTAYGVDVIEPRFADEQKWTFLQLDLDKSDWDLSLTKSFDLILAFDIIEHLHSPYQFLKSCQRLCAPGGQLILTTPNSQSWERYYRPTSWSGVQDPQHKILFTRYSLDFLLQRVGFSFWKTSAPVRSLSFLGPLQPQIGGQLFSVARV